MTDLQKEIGQLIQKYERQQKRAAAPQVGAAAFLVVGAYLAGYLRNDTGR